MHVKKAELFILLVLLLLGCALTDDSSELAFLDIVDAEQLFIGSVAASKSRKGSSDRLFKITDAGYVEEVSYLDQDGNEITELFHPVAVYNGNETYVIVCFGYNVHAVDRGYLVRKSDGAVFSLGDEGFPELNYAFKNPLHVCSDNQGNIYFKGRLKETIGDFSVLLKIDTANPENLTREVYSAPTDLVRQFVIDPSGNAIYMGGLRDGTTWGTVRLRKANGGLYNLPVHAAFWIGLDENAYFCTSTRDEFGFISYIIKKIVIDDSYDVSVLDYSEITDGIPELSESFKLSLQDRIIIVQPNSGIIVEIYNPSETPRVISTLPDFQTIRATVASGTYYYLAGYDPNLQNVVLRVDPTNDSYTYLLNSRELEVQKISVSDSDVLTFSALRFTDGKKIIGEIDVNEVVTVLDEELNVTVVSLERIR